MKNVKLLAAIVATIFAILSAGCSNIPKYNAEEVHQIISLPGFSDEFHANDLHKDTLPDGTVVRRAEAATHSTRILGFGRTANYKNVILEVSPEVAKP